MRKLAVGVVAAVAIIAGIIVLIGRDAIDMPQPRPDEIAVEDECVAHGTVMSQLQKVVPSREDSCAAAEPQLQSAGERRKAEDEKQVDDFDNLIDDWVKPSSKGVAMTDVDNFVASFHKIPKARQDECIHRALNLVPDENVMLLSGVLLDKTMDKKIVEMVYYDILNRDENAKKTI